MGRRGQRARTQQEGPRLNLAERFGFQRLGMLNVLILNVVPFHWLVPPPFLGHEKTFRQEQRGDGRVYQPPPAVIAFHPHVASEVGSLFPFAAKEKKAQRWDVNCLRSQVHSTRK